MAKKKKEPEIVVEQLFKSENVPPPALDRDPNAAPFDEKLNNALEQYIITNMIPAYNVWRNVAETDDCYLVAIYK